MADLGYAVMADSRYIVSWVPTTEVEKLCLARGKKAGDQTSFWDWIDPSECERQMEKSTFFEAIFAAKAILPFDVCGEVRICRQSLILDHDDLGNVFKTLSWEEDAVWHVHDKTDDPAEDAPEYRCEAA